MHETIRTASGARLAVYSQDLDYFIMIDVLGGIHDAHIVKLCVESLREGDVFYDIGANAGMVTIEVQSAFKDRVQTFAFEPQPGLATNCALSARMNGFEHVQVWPIMLAREAGEGHLFVPERGIHASMVSRGRGRDLACVKLPLDELVMGGKIPAPRVIKIDVEGGEREVVAGAKQVIATYRPILVMEADINMKRFGYKRSDLIGDVAELGSYRFEVFRSGGWESLDAIDDVNEDGISDIAAFPA